MNGTTNVYGKPTTPGAKVYEVHGQQMTVAELLDYAKQVRGYTCRQTREMSWAALGPDLAAALRDAQEVR